MSSVDEFIELMQRECTRATQHVKPLLARECEITQALVTKPSEVQRAALMQESRELQEKVDTSRAHLKACTTALNLSTELKHNVTRWTSEIQELSERHARVVRQQRSRSSPEGSLLGDAVSLRRNIIERESQLRLQAAQTRLLHSEISIYTALDSANIALLHPEMQLLHTKEKDRLAAVPPISSTNSSEKALLTAAAGALRVLGAWKQQDVCSDPTKLLNVLNQVTLELQTHTLEIKRNRELKWWIKILQGWQTSLDTLCGTAATLMLANREPSQSSRPKERQSNQSSSIQQRPTQQPRQRFRSGQSRTQTSPKAALAAAAATGSQMEAVKPQDLNPEPTLCSQSDYSRLGIRILSASDKHPHSEFIQSSSALSTIAPAERSRWEIYLSEKLEGVANTKVHPLQFTPASSNKILGPLTPRSSSCMKPADK